MASLHRKTLFRLRTFGSRKTSERIITGCLGSFLVKVNSNANSDIKGTVDIGNQTIPILFIKPRSEKSIDECFCILLLDGNQSFTNFEFGVIVEDMLDIPKITKAKYNSLPERDL